MTGFQGRMKVHCLERSARPVAARWIFWQRCRMLSLHNEHYGAGDDRGPQTVFVSMGGLRNAAADK